MHGFRGDSVAKLGCLRIFGVRLSYSGRFFSLFRLIPKRVFVLLPPCQSIAAVPGGEFLKLLKESWLDEKVEIHHILPSQITWEIN